MAELGMLVLAVDACGPLATVALGRIAEEGPVSIVGLRQLEGRQASALLVNAVRELLADAGTSKPQAILCVNGPGSFTGVRLGLATAKGLAEAWQLPVGVVSRLKVLAAKAGLDAAALDAHRSEFFLRPGQAAPEMLAGAEQLAALTPPPRLAVCDEAAAGLLTTAWPATELVRVAPPTAADALTLCWAAIAAAGFEDLALLNAHYLRRSDAEIFAHKIAAARVS